MKTNKYVPKHERKRSLNPAKKILPIFLAVMLLFSNVTPALAAETVLEKEEVIYINLTADGSVEDVYAVNIFGRGNITDYGEYSSVEVLNTKDKINLKGDCITLSSSADRVYYKGKMKNTEIPWDISIKYFIDGVEYSADEVAGKSGKLDIKFKITKNSSYSGEFFENYALQAAFTLDTERCRNITADNATLVNVGSKKQITYTILPNEGIDTVITADVTNFEMAAVSINGLPLSLNIEIDDSELMNQVTELLSAIEELDKGASDLKSAVENLNDGVVMLQSGLTELNAKSYSLTNGSSEIKNALILIQRELSAVDSLSQSITELQNNLSFAAYKEVMKQNGLNIDSLQSANSQTIQALTEQIYTLRQQADSLEQMGGDTEQIAQLRASAEQLQEIVTLLQGNSAAINGMDAYLTQISTEIVSQLSELLVNLTSLKTGIDTLVTEYSKLDTGINGYTGGVAQIVTGYSQIAAGTGELLKGSGKLKSGTGEMLAETSGMDKQISEKIDDMISSFTGTSSEVASFVSEKNTSVKSVQFVIQTKEIKVDNTKTAAPAVKEKLTFWQKILRLFGLN